MTIARSSLTAARHASSSVCALRLEGCGTSMTGTSGREDHSSTARCAIPPNAITASSGAEGCERLAQAVVAIGERQTGRRGTEEVWLCAACAERFQHAPSVTINGRRLINDGAGSLLPIPNRVGRG